MTIKLNAAARIAQVKLEAAPDKLYSRFVKVLGKETSKHEDKKFGRQVVEWILGHHRSRNITFSMQWFPKGDAVRLIYQGIADTIITPDGDEKKALAALRRMAKGWLDSGEATPEDREYLERVLSVK